MCMQRRMASSPTADRHSLDVRCARASPVVLYETGETPSNYLSGKAGNRVSPPGAAFTQLTGGAGMRKGPVVMTVPAPPRSMSERLSCATILRE